MDIRQLKYFLAVVDHNGCAASDSLRCAYAAMSVIATRCPGSIRLGGEGLGTCENPK